MKGVGTGVRDAHSEERQRRRAALLKTGAAAAPSVVASVRSSRARPDG